MQKSLLITVLILITNFSFAQTNDYLTLWQKVEEFEIDGLSKSALKVVEEIAVSAKKNQDNAQIIKSLLFKSKFALLLEEDAQLKIINDFNAEIAASEFPTKNILESMLANLYWQYFEQNRWQFYNRTKTEEKVDATDFRTWDLETLFEEITLHYSNSLQNGLLAQLTSLDEYDAILTLHEDSTIYRPTLFDFLSHNALQFYKTDENSISKPAYKFELDNPDLLSNAKTFSRIRITSKDSTSLQLLALKTYQKLIKFHLKDETPFALANVDIERLKFVKQHATFSNKEALLLDALRASRTGLKESEVSGLYGYEIASIYNQQGYLYQAKNDDTQKHRWQRKEALQICDYIIKKFPNSKGALKSTVLKQQILLPSLQITAENYLPINSPSRILIKYRNHTELQFKVYSISKKQLNLFKKIYQKEEQLTFIKKLNLVKQWESTLRNENDYQSHSTEVLLPSLNNGIYIVFASPENNDEQTFAFKTIQVTDIALVEKNTDSEKIFQLINRNNGRPLINAIAKISYRKNSRKNYSSRTLTSNKYGEIYFEKNNAYYNNITVNVSYKKERAFFGEFYSNRYYRNYNNDKEITYKAFLFTDRSIYRPGQTLYFKGIVMKTDLSNKSEVLPNETVYVTLYNVNGQAEKELELKTNEFGSVSGEFILPNSGLTGQYYIDIDGENYDLYSETYFSIEEYKRPKFETKFTPITETFKVNDSVTIKGEALAYTGSTITDAKVVYRVKRNVEYPRWYYWYRPWFSSNPQEITHGETMTNAKGEYEIIFKALPDQSVDKKSLPVFNYEITADVIDINGETRSATTIVRVGYHSLIASVSVSEKIDKLKKDHVLSIDTRNLNGEFVPAKGTVKIYKLQAPKNVVRTRPWENPDYQEFTETAFDSLFPHDSYTNSDDFRKWKKGELVFSKTFDTKKETELKLGNIKKWASGNYIIKLSSKDKFGQEVKDIAYTKLYSVKDKTIADKQLFSITTNKFSYADGDVVQLKLASAATNLTVTVDIEKDHKIVSRYLVYLNNDIKTLSIPVTKEDVGGFAIHYSFAAFNNFKTNTIHISVPYPKTQLEIETTTFRDKLQPGQDETWSFKVKGPKGERVSAEVLASMYDVSLDQFKTHQWNFNPITNPYYYSYNDRNAGHSFGVSNFRIFNKLVTNAFSRSQDYDQLNWFGFYFADNQYYLYSKKIEFRSLDNAIEVVNDESNFDARNEEELANIISEKASGVVITSQNGTSGAATNVVIRGYNSISENNKQLIIIDGVPATYSEFSKLKTSEIESIKTLKGIEAAKLYGTDARNGVVIIITKSAAKQLSNVKVRKNLQETAFFFPHLKTDEEGNVTFSFTTPEALTKWKLQLLAHTKTLESVIAQFETVTQKELMVIPNPPRFLREGDEITISTKIANLTENSLSGNAILELTDAISGKDVSSILLVYSTTLSDQIKPFTVNAKGNTQVLWKLNIPEGIQAVQYKIIAKAGDFSDGEQNALPVLSNRMLVTETLPMWIRSNQTKTFTLDKLKNSTSTTRKNHLLTLEITSNPAWYAVQALPYLMEYPYECNEQTFSRYYANALASHIANSNPRIQEVFNQWKNSDALLSNLEKNEELKSILIQETPWLRDAQSETEQKKRIALLFDLNKMKNELQTAKRKLEQNQMNSGGWPWFAGGYESRYITQHIITGFGHLKQLNVIPIERGTSDEESHKLMIKKAVKYLDAQFVKEYKDLRKYNKDVDLSKDHLSYNQLHYLYMRSFYPDINKSKEVEEITKYYHSQIKKYWLSRTLYAKGLMSLITFRMNDTGTANKIINSLKETSITSSTLGMYWKENTSSWHWYQAPIETQALLIEAFSEIENDVVTIDNLKIWLLKNKQTNRWSTTKSTTEAVYALLLQGSDWLSVSDMVEVLVGGEAISPSKLENVQVEAGTGYYKTSWGSAEIKPEMADITLTKKGNGIAWGALYWQYFEDLDNITSAETPLKLKKKLFLKTNTDTGEELSEITTATKLKVGDLVRVRIELRVDRVMEFVHMKDMRAAGFEPINVLSRYKWQDGLGYYESTKDASTNFFFDYLPKGVYVFEYDLRVNNVGNMSNGITTIQSMYAPEFNSHSDGVRVIVE